MGAHLVDGEFQSDKYPWCPKGFVALKLTDKAAQPVLWMYAQSHRERDAEFSDDLEAALRLKGFQPLMAVPVAQAVGHCLDFDDPDAQDLIWTYAKRRAARDPNFSLAVIEAGLRKAGYEPPESK